jgi:hypothetical protein
MGKGEEKVNRRLALIISHKDAENTRCHALPFRVFRVFRGSNKNHRPHGPHGKHKIFRLLMPAAPSLFVYSLYSVVPSLRDFFGQILILWDDAEKKLVFLFIFDYFVHSF